MLTIDIFKNYFDLEQRCKLASVEPLLRSFGNYGEAANTSGDIGRMSFTDITPFAFADAVSGLNMVYDISHIPKFASLVGFAQNDLQVALEKMGMIIVSNMSNMSVFTIRWLVFTIYIVKLARLPHTSSTPTSPFLLTTWSSSWPNTQS